MICGASVVSMVLLGSAMAASLAGPGAVPAAAAMIFPADAEWGVRGVQSQFVVGEQLCPEC